MHRVSDRAIDPGWRPCQVRGLRVHYHTPRGVIRAVDDVSFDLRRGERLGLVGESGSGKSTVASALLRLIKPPGRFEAGEARLDGVDLLAVPEKEMRRLRLAAIALVAQGAMNSLNPVLKVRRQMVDALRDHGERPGRTGTEARFVHLLERSAGERSWPWIALSPVCPTSRAGMGWSSSGPIDRVQAAPSVPPPSGRVAYVRSGIAHGWSGEPVAPRRRSGAPKKTNS